MNIRSKLREGSVSSPTSALNDILFILLLFFLIVATLANPNVIKLTNPKAQSDTKAKQSVVVSIDDKQQFFVGTTLVTPEQLTVAIAEVMSKNTETEKTVVINADKLATADNVVAVMRAAQTLKIRTVLAVDKSQ
jgi:biopolymer transport protein ExbD